MQVLFDALRTPQPDYTKVPLKRDNSTLVDWTVVPCEVNWCVLQLRVDPCFCALSACCQCRGVTLGKAAFVGTVFGLAACYTRYHQAMVNQESPEIMGARNRHMMSMTMRARYAKWGAIGAVGIMLPVVGFFGVRDIMGGDSIYAWALGATGWATYVRIMTQHRAFGWFTLMFGVPIACAVQQNKLFQVRHRREQRAAHNLGFMPGYSPTSLMPNDTSAGQYADEHPYDTKVQAWLSERQAHREMVYRQREAVFED
ncbi:MAG: hypothetical protein MHM6MM_000481 [Cercozoa sp. M6MM]